METWFEKVELTADVCRFTKCGSNIWVEFNHKVTLFCDSVVSIFDLLGYPDSEVITSKRINHIDQPLAWKLWHVSLVRQVLFDLLDLAAILQDAVNGESIVHGDVQVLCIL